MADTRDRKIPNMYVNIDTDAQKSVKFIEGWLELKGSDNTWSRYWCVLKNDIIFFFKNHKTSAETLVGNIALGPEPKLEKLDGNERSGYKFNLYSGSRLNTFRGQKYSERELWKAYVEGIATGKVNDTSELLPGQIREVQARLEEYFTHRPQARPFPLKQNSASNHSKDGFDTPNTSTSGSFHQFDSGYLVPEQKGLPAAHIQEHKFYSDPTRTDIPSWFFSQCSRDLAMRILKLGATYGNTLMRESISQSQTLVISKRTKTASESFTHYALKITPQGYKIDVENPHEPMKTLSEVMDFFVSTSGKTSTFPMKCNDLKSLGIEDDGYSRNIVTTQRDADSGEELADTDTYKSWSMSEGGPPEPPAPPVPHGVRKDIMQNKNPRERWNLRSASVPSICQEDLSQLQRPPQRILPASSQTPHPSASKTVPPPLPPNHPPPKTPASHLSGIGSTNNLSSSERRIGPQHSQSLDSVDMSSRNSPGGLQSRSNATEKLTQAMTKTGRQNLEEAPKAVEAAARSVSGNEVIKSPAAATDSFKQKLDRLLASPNTSGLRPGMQTSCTSPAGNNLYNDYESIAHYSNANEIQSARK